MKFILRKVGLLIIALGAFSVAYFPELATILANIGECLTQVALWLDCYGIQNFLTLFQSMIE